MSSLGLSISIRGGSVDLKVHLIVESSIPLSMVTFSNSMYLYSV